MSGQYSYDESGQTYFFVTTVTGLVLIPYTAYTLYSAWKQRKPKASAPTKGWDQKSPDVVQVKKEKDTGVLSNKKILALVVAWIIFGFFFYKTLHVKTDTKGFDPYEILGISIGATEKQIKKHYRKLSLKFHPDKVKLLPDQSKEEVDNMFVTLTKAYKALTNDEVRKNMELYGHPDGRQEVTNGIALPSWIVSGKNAPLVIAAYALLLGGVLPYVVGKWWYKSRSHNKDGVLNSTTAKFFKHLTNERQTSLNELLDVISLADEYQPSPFWNAIREDDGGEVVALYPKIRPMMELTGFKDLPETIEKSSLSIPLRVKMLIVMYLFRVPVTGTSVKREISESVYLATLFASSISQIALSRNWLRLYVASVRLLQLLVQGVHPTNSPLLLLPFVNAPDVSKDTTLGDVARASSVSEVAKLLGGITEKEAQVSWDIAKHLPRLDLISTTVKVTGEKKIVPNSTMLIACKVRLGKFSDPVPKVDVSINDDGAPETEPDSNEGSEAAPNAHAPRFPEQRVATWNFFVADHKLDRIFIPPQAISDIGYNQPRTITLVQQAPASSGVYTLQLHIMSDSYVGADAQVALKIVVEDPPEGANEGGSESDADVKEDDISEPEEDSLAGQLAMMKGQSVTKSKGDTDDSSSDDDNADDDEMSTTDTDSD